MPTTYLQTVEILYPNTTLVHYGQEPRPVAPEWVKESSEPEAILAEDRTIVWFKDGLCEVYTPDGAKRRFWPKPTIADAVLSPPCDGSYYRFHADGTVEEVYKGMNFRWGPATLAAKEVNGQALGARVERCDDGSPFGYFSIYDKQVSFDLAPDGYLWNRSCDCTDCYFEERSAYYRRRHTMACSCIDCRDSDDEFIHSPK